jgi:predicted nuclease of predicted toxin-antitoxin system
VWLRAQGFEAAHAFELGLQAADDLSLVEHATANGAIIVTKDRDFVHLAAAKSDLRVVLVCIGNCSSRQLMDKFTRLLPEVLSHFDAGKRVVELR